MKQYIDLNKRILKDGVYVPNTRTGKGTIAVIGAELVYDVGANELPLVTTRQCYWRSATAEIIGYLQGLSNAEDFAALGTKTWRMNANENKVWLASEYRFGEGDMGRVYGVQLRKWKRPDGTTIDQLQKVYDNLKSGIDDRGEILMMHNPGELEQGCLRACMYSHTFSLLGDTLHLTSVQRSYDSPLGGTFNAVQCFVLLKLMAQITGHKPGLARHQIVNCHIYEDQIELMKEQVTRKPFPLPKMFIDPSITTLEDVDDMTDTSAFSIEGYRYHPAIVYPFSV